MIPVYEIKKQLWNDPKMKMLPVFFRVGRKSAKDFR